MRIVGGSTKGRKIRVSKKGIRPTKSIVRKGIFDVLSTKINNSYVLDVFAGSGALGLEAISRGAKNCVFVEKNPKILLENIRTFSFKNKSKVIAGDFRLGLKKVNNKRFDIIFLDPPYHRSYISKILKLISKYRLLRNKGIIVAEHDKQENFITPSEFLIYKKKKYGNTAITFITQNSNHTQ
jgi:16S rRNA (guanine(966)-N(2))-methyltransferase RsmD